MLLTSLIPLYLPITPGNCSKVKKNFILKIKLFLEYLNIEIGNEKPAISPQNFIINDLKKIMFN